MAAIGPSRRLCLDVAASAAEGITARALLGWSRDTLAAKSGTGAETVQGFKSRVSDPKLSTLHKWIRALEAAGVRFIDEDANDGPGVRLKHDSKPAGKRN